jgi:hypothetical protein
VQLLPLLYGGPLRLAEPSRGFIGTESTIRRSNWGEETPKAKLQKGPDAMNHRLIIMHHSFINLLVIVIQRLMVCHLSFQSINHPPEPTPKRKGNRGTCGWQVM